jgi:CMP-N,N'-diacetyllegionaminic acid synthase
MKIFSLIQARGGSKGVPKKNIKLLGGYPLIAYSIAASKLTKSIQRTIFSTESPEIAEIAKRYGAEVPFLRPAEFAQDHSGDLEVLSHAIEWLDKEEGQVPDLLVQLRPTTPLRDPSFIEEAIKKIKSNPEATSLRSAHQVGQPPQKMFQVGTAGFWAGFFPNDPRPEYYNLPRQLFPDAFCPNGHVDIVKPELIKNKVSQPFGSKIMSFVTPFVPDIDRLEDFEHAEFILNKYSSPLLEYLSSNFPKEKN